MVILPYLLALLFSSLSGLRVLGDVALSDIVLASAIAAYLVTNPGLILASQFSTDSGQRLIYTGIIVYCVGVLITGSYHDTMGDAIYILSQFAFLALWFFVASNLGVNVAVSRLFSGTIVLSATISTAAAVLQSLGLLTAYGAALEGRMVGLARHPNELGMASAYSTALAFGAWLFEPRVSKSRKYWLVGWLLSVLGVILSGSLSAMGSMLVAMGYALYAFLRVAGAVKFARIALRFVVACGVAFICILVAISLGYIDLYDPNFILNRFNRISETSDDYNTAAIRYEGYKNALEYIWANPLIGTGGAGGGQTDVGDQIHNIFLKAWMDAGLFAFLGVAVMIVGALLSMTTGFRRIADPRASGLIIGTYAGVCTFLIGAQTAPLSTQRTAWIAFAMLFGVTSIPLSTTANADSKGVGRVV